MLALGPLALRAAFAVAGAIGAAGGVWLAKQEGPKEEQTVQKNHPQTVTLSSHEIQKRAEQDAPFARVWDEMLRRPVANIEEPAPVQEEAKSNFNSVAYPDKRSRQIALARELYMDYQSSQDQGAEKFFLLHDAINMLPNTFDDAHQLGLDDDSTNRLLHEHANRAMYEFQEKLTLAKPGRDTMLLIDELKIISSFSSIDPEAIGLSEEWLNTIKNASEPVAAGQAMNDIRRNMGEIERIKQTGVDDGQFLDANFHTIKELISYLPPSYMAGKAELPPGLNFSDEEFQSLMEAQLEAQRSVFNKLIPSLIPGAPELK